MVVLIIAVEIRNPFKGYQTWHIITSIRIVIEECVLLLLILFYTVINFISQQITFRCQFQTDGLIRVWLSMLNNVVWIQILQNIHSGKQATIKTTFYYIKRKCGWAAYKEGTCQELKPRFSLRFWFFFNKPENVTHLNSLLGKEQSVFTTKCHLNICNLC